MGLGVSKRNTEPFRWGNNDGAIEGGICFDLLGEHFRRGSVTLVIIGDRDEVDADTSVFSLGEDGCAGPKG